MRLQTKAWTKSTLLIFCFIITSIISMAQVGHVKGIVRSNDGEPVQYVSIQLKEIKGGVLSAEDGSFLLKNIKEGKYTLLVSFVGLKQQTQIIEIKSGETHTIDFKLPENASQLTEVVVAYSKGINEKPVTVGKVNIKPMDLP